MSEVQLAYEWGYHYLELGREKIVYGGVGMHWTKINTHLNIAVSETMFSRRPGAVLNFLQGLSLEMGEGWLQGTVWHSSTPCHLNLLQDKVSEHTGCLNVSILLYTTDPYTDYHRSGF